MTDKKQLVIVGAGSGGLAAAVSAKENGIDDILIIEREKMSGGILNQCIHDGFGLIRYGQALTGPEYAHRLWQDVRRMQIEVRTNTMVTGFFADKKLRLCSPEGVREIQAKAVIFATGCRERTRGSLRIAGSRPAGIFTAGSAQNLVNLKNMMPGKKVLILGSGDIGLIMARRLTLEGAQVAGVFEIMGHTGGLERNVCQCLMDYDIPFFLRRTVTQIHGKKRIEKVTTTGVDESCHPVAGTEKEYACDTLILSAGLVPENEIIKKAGIRTDPVSQGAVTDEYLQTGIPGVFVCGNARKVLDLADTVSAEGACAGKNAACYLSGRNMEPLQHTEHPQLPKGVPQPGRITCTVCPRGCHLKAESTDGHDSVIKGYACPRGLDYGKRELIHPARILTTTVKMENGMLLPVKSREPVAKEQLLSVSKELKTIVLPDGPYTCGQTVMLAGRAFVAGQDVEAGERLWKKDCMH